MDIDILGRLTARAEQAEVVHLQNEFTTVKFDANRLKTSEVEETSGAAVRVVKDGRLGFAASSDTSPAALEKLVGNALESAAFGEQIPIDFPAPQPAPAVRTFDRAIADLPIARMVELGQEIIETLLAADPDVRASVELKRGVQRRRIRNQAGAEIAVERSPFSIGVEFMRVKGDDVLVMADSFGAMLWPDDPLAFVGEPGPTPAADLIAGIDEGLLVEDVLGLGQGNVLSGAFSNPLSLGFKIEKGKIAGRVKQASIDGNAYEALREAAAISRETRWVYNSFSLPYILVPDLNVVAKAA